MIMMMMMEDDADTADGGGGGADGDAAVLVGILTAIASSFAVMAGPTLSPFTIRSRAL